MDDLVADLNAQDDDGLGWSTPTRRSECDRARCCSRGTARPKPWSRVVAIDEDGQVHFPILPGQVAKNRHLLDRTVA